MDGNVGIRLSVTLRAISHHSKMSRIAIYIDDCTFCFLLASLLIDTFNSLKCKVTSQLE